MSWAKSGIKVVCIDHSFRAGESIRNGARLPPMRTVLSVSAVIDDYLGRGLCLVIDGYPNRSLRLGHDMGWVIERFRPITTRTQEQDLELFLPLLKPSPVDAGLIPAGVEVE